MAETISSTSPELTFCLMVVGEVSGEGDLGVDPLRLLSTASAAKLSSSPPRSPSVWVTFSGAARATAPPSTKLRVPPSRPPHPIIRRRHTQLRIIPTTVPPRRLTHQIPLRLHSPPSCALGPLCPRGVSHSPHIPHSYGDGAPARNEYGVEQNVVGRDKPKVTTERERAQRHTAKGRVEGSPSLGSTRA